MSDRRDDGTDDRDRDRFPGSQPRPQQRDERRGCGRVEPEALGIAERVPRERPDQRHEVPSDVDAEARHPEPEAPQRPRGLRDRDRGRLVDRQLRDREPAPPGRQHRRRQLQAVERVPQPQQGRGGDGGTDRATSPEDADQCELRSTAEQQQRQQARLQHAEPARDGERAEADAVEPSRDGHRQPLSDDGATIVRDGNGGCSRSPIKHAGPRCSPWPATGRAGSSHRFDDRSEPP